MSLRHAALAPCLVLVLGTACQREGGDSASRMDELDKRSAAIDARLVRLERFLEPHMPPPEPDPMAVYAVPIEGAAYKGPEVAPVTIVEAFEFA